MSTDDELFGPGRSRAFSPFLAPGERKQLHDLLNVGSGLPPSFADELRALARRYVDDGDSIKLRAICLLVADLCEQGWRVLVGSDRITFEPPGISRDGLQSVDDVKARVRSALQTARMRQLREPSVRQFLARMERRTNRGGQKSSIADLIDDGAHLARALRSVEGLAGDDRLNALAAVIAPVVEVCEAGARPSIPSMKLKRLVSQTRPRTAVARPAQGHRPLPAKNSGLTPSKHRTAHAAAIR